MIACPEPLVIGDFDGDPGELVSFTVTATDAEDYAPALVCVPTSGSFFPRGTTLVTCTATDFSGNQASCQFPVTVRSQLRELSPSPR